VWKPASTLNLCAQCLGPSALADHKHGTRIRIAAGLQICGAASKDAPPLLKQCLSRRNFRARFDLSEYIHVCSSENLERYKSLLLRTVRTASLENTLEASGNTR
jgi:hypothetical protein